MDKGRIVTYARTISPALGKGGRKKTECRATVLAREITPKSILSSTIVY